MANLVRGDVGRRARRLVLALWWVFPALLSAASLSLRAMTGGGEPAWGKTLLIQLLVWSLWLGFAPLILKLGRRFRIGGRRWWRGLLFHAAAGFALPLVYLVFYAAALNVSATKAVSIQSLAETYVGVFLYVFHWDVVIYWAILGAGYAIEYYDQIRERELREVRLEKRLVDAQLANLQAQLQPHFLFNALHTIGSLVRQERSDEALRMLSGLSDLLRTSLENSGEHETTLREEFEFIRRYLDIQRVRFTDRLKVEITAPPESLDSRVPALFLQPIVENAFRHGLDQQSENGLISIDAKRRNGRLEVSVFNDGPQLPSDWETAGSAGVGLTNTQERLHQLYGNRASLQLESREGGVEARVVIPQAGEEAS